MVHRIFGWLGGIVKVRLRGEFQERFLNLCRNHGIEIWEIRQDKKSGLLYFRIRLRDFYRLRPIGKKCKVRLLIVERYGLPFGIQAMRARKSFWCGVALFCALLIFYSSRIWGITVEGASYHTQESIVKYLSEINVYGGMAKKDLHCAGIEEQLRKKYEDVGWANAEERGNRLLIRVREVLLVSAEQKKKKGHLIAEDAGEVVSIVTRRGTAKVKAGKKVKKGAVLISGMVPVYGDGEELLEKNYVHAEGEVILRNKEKYEEVINKRYQKKVYTGRTRTVYGWYLGNQQFFLYNPLKNLESYEKYDIIRDSGLLCPFLPNAFQARYDKKTFRELKYQDAEYSRKEAEELLFSRYKYYLEKKKKAGYTLDRADVRFEVRGDSYACTGTVYFRKKQGKYKEIHSKNKKYYKDTDKNGNNGNNH